LALRGRTREHVVVERVTPELDAGRYPVKRLLGELCSISADVYLGGEDAIRARIAYRPPGASSWLYAPLEHRHDVDRWFGALRCDRPGRWCFRIEAWPDHFETWRGGLRRRVAAGQDVTGELGEGAALLSRAAAQQEGAARRELEAAAQQLGASERPLAERLAAAFDERLQAAAPLEPEELSCSAQREISVDRREAAWGAWYELFPRSQASEPGRHGRFADVERRLPELAELGFDVVYLPPIHPIGRAQRKGPNNRVSADPHDPGSPWAIGAAEGGHCAVHPELGTLDDFERLVASARGLGMELALDYALQCSPDHPWVREHPDWFRVAADGSIRCAENPPKRYEDIYPLDLWCKDRESLWSACRDILLFWIARGVRIFRVDNPHTKPFAFWEWLLREVQALHPEAIFLAEAFTRPKPMRGLAKLGFTQSYTYFTWKNTSWELRDYLSELAHGEMAEYFRPNFFANTPDILHEYLQRGGRPAFRIRLLLAGTLSPAYGIYSGFELCENQPLHEGSEEYLHSEKYEIRARDWHAPGNILDDVRRLNRIRRENPALQQLSQIEFLPSENPSFLCYRKWVPGNQLLAAVNLDPQRAQESVLELAPEQLGLPAHAPIELEDLLTGARYTWHGSRHYLRVDPFEQPGHLFRVTSARPW
jgi:starch synthase (maltosyl-transferring)